MRLLLTDANVVMSVQLQPSASRQVELKARCNVPIVEFLLNEWFYKHYDAIFYKDVRDGNDLIGIQLAQRYRDKEAGDSSFLVECNYTNNQSIETWTSDYGNVRLFTLKLRHTGKECEGDWGVTALTHKSKKKEVCIASLSEGKWIKTNPRIWETNGTYYEIDETNNNIKGIISDKDPLITGKVAKRLANSNAPSAAAKKGQGAVVPPPPPNPQKDDNGFLDQHINAIMSSNPCNKQYLPTTKDYRFNQILKDNSHCLPFAIIRGEMFNTNLKKDVRELFAREFQRSFRNVAFDERNVRFFKIPATSLLLRHPKEDALVMYYVDVFVGFKTLTDQRLWWRHLQNVIDKSPKLSHMKYFTTINGQYQEHYHIDFDVYEENVSIPIVIDYPNYAVVCPAACRKNYDNDRVPNNNAEKGDIGEDASSSEVEEDGDGDDGGNNDNSDRSNNNADSAGSDAKASRFKILTFDFIRNPSDKLASFSDIQLKNVLKAAFPNVSTASFSKCVGNNITFKRRNCLMGVMCGVPGHVCKEEFGTLTLNTVFDKVGDRKNAICQLLYSCDCMKETPGQFLAYIDNTTSSDVDNTQAKDQDKEEDLHAVYNPVTLDEEVSFPEDMNFEATIKNTDIGCAEVFEKIYNKRFLYSPEGEHFYYFDGDIWQKDKNSGFTEALIAKKLSSCMDPHIDEIRDELDREYARQIQNKGQIMVLQKRLKKCDDQRKRLTDGTSRVKGFIKTKMTDLFFKKKSEHVGKIAASNGVVDLRTGKISMFRPTDFITEKCNFAYYKCSCAPGHCFDRDALGNIKCNSVIANSMQRLDDIIKEIMGCDCLDSNDMPKHGDRLYYHWMWCIGYGITGDGNRKHFFYCHSPQNSGKSLLLESVIEILSPYFGVIPKGLIFGKKNANGPTPEVVLVLGKRAGFCDEVGKDDKFDDRNVKAITGRSRTEWRGMGKEYETTKFKLVPFVAANHYADIPSLDPAFWDRLMPVLFPMVFERDLKTVDKHTNQRLRDITIADKFETEEFQVAYFNWLIRASAYYYANPNKQIPIEIQEKIKELRKESFTLDEFINSSDKYSFDEDSKTPIKMLYDDFKKFTQENSIKSKQEFSLAQFRNMIREIAADEGYDKRLGIEDMKGKTVLGMVKGIKCNTAEETNTIDTDYSNSHKRSHYDPGEDEDNKSNKKAKNNDLLTGDDIRTV